MLECKTEKQKNIYIILENDLVLWCCCQEYLATRISPVQLRNASRKRGVFKLEPSLFGIATKMEYKRIGPSLRETYSIKRSDLNFQLIQVKRMAKGDHGSFTKINIRQWLTSN